ncbi:MAG: hypothetical protein VYD19_05715, partial [Myxococcota bacterium]|nr:hypothetical protein [Myxococcota bacterium]
TPEMGVRFAEARVELYEAIKALELDEIAAWGDQLDRARFQRELIAVAEQLLSGERLRVQLLKLVEGLLEMGEETPLGELLGDEVVRLLRDALRMQAPPLCARFAESEALAGWARRYLG